MRVESICVGFAIAAIAACSSSTGTNDVDMGASMYDAAADASLHNDAPLDAYVDLSTTDSSVDASSVDLGVVLCGNGVFDGIEDCDDGNTIDDDGCSSMCTFELLSCVDPSVFRETHVGEVAMGNTAGQPNFAHGTCGGIEAPEDVYVVTLDREESDVTIWVESEHPAALYVSTGCALSEELTCAIATATSPAAVSFSGSAGDRFFVFVDGRSGGSGTYRLHLERPMFLPDGATCDPTAHSIIDQCDGYHSLCVDGPEGGICTPYDVVESSTCGDHVVGYGAELCDDGNHTNGDGCDAHCMLEPSPCSEEIEALPLNGTVTGTLSGTTNTTFGTCGGGGSGERVYTFDLPEQAFVTIDTDSTATSFRPVLYMRTTCDDPRYAVSEVTCDWAGSPGYAATGGSPLEAGHYFVFVDGLSGESGDFVLRTHTFPLVAEGAPCLLAGAGEEGKCADGLQCFETFAGQVCMDPSAVAGSAVCGDGVVTAPPEMCDDHNTMNGDGCNSHCRVEGHVCADPEVLSVLPETAVVHGSTVGLPSTTYSECGGALSGEVVYRFDLATESFVHFLVTPAEGFMPVLVVRESCSIGYGSQACQNATDISPAGLDYLPMDAGTYYIFVDGLAGTSGEFDISVTSVPLVGEGGECFDWLPVETGHCATGLRCVDYASGGRCEP